MPGSRAAFNTFKIGLTDIEAAATRISRHVIRTPLLPCPILGKRFDGALWFKAENLQHIGAFKARGASNAVFSLDDAIAARGVATHSSGNHAAALARAAALRGIPAHIVMPRNSMPNKLAAVRQFGIEPFLCEPDEPSRSAAAALIATETGATLIHPFNDLAVMAGQGTVGLEILEQAESAGIQIDCVVVPVGGGGLLSGILVAIKSLRPNIEVIAAEPEWADDAARSLRSGKIEIPNRYDTVADGLRTPLGENTFPVIRSLVDGIVLVSESAIIGAVRTIAAESRLVAEPSGAVSLAAVLENPERFRGKNVAAVISGGNLNLKSGILSGNP